MSCSFTSADLPLSIPERIRSSPKIHRTPPPRYPPPHPPQHPAPLLLLLRVASVEPPPLLPMVLGILALLIARRLLHVDLLDRHPLRFQRRLQLPKAVAQQSGRFVVGRLKRGVHDPIPHLHAHL